MKPCFALLIGQDGLSLLQRRPDGWLPLGSVDFSDPDLTDALGDLRALAADLEPEGFTTKLVLPDSEILYTRVRAPGPSNAIRRAQIEAALEGMTPYALEDLVFDWHEEKGSDEVEVAAVARETLAEAEAFATEYMFNPVSFVALPEVSGFAIEPWFGLTSHAAAMRQPPLPIQIRDRELMHVLPATSLLDRHQLDEDDLTAEDEVIEEIDASCALDELMARSQAGAASPAPEAVESPAAQPEPLPPVPVQVAAEPEPVPEPAPVPVQPAPVQAVAAEVEFAQPQPEPVPEPIQQVQARPAAIEAIIPDVVIDAAPVDPVPMLEAIAAPIDMQPEPTVQADPAPMPTSAPAVTLPHDPVDVPVQEPEAVRPAVQAAGVAAVLAAQLIDQKSEVATPAAPEPESGQEPLAEAPYYEVDAPDWTTQSAPVEEAPIVTPAALAASLSAPVPPLATPAPAVAPARSPLAATRGKPVAARRPTGTPAKGVQTDESLARLPARAAPSGTQGSGRRKILLVALLLALLAGIAVLASGFLATDPELGYLDDNEAPLVPLPASAERLLDEAESEDLAADTAEGIDGQAPVATPLIEAQNRTPAGDREVAQPALEALLLPPPDSTIAGAPGIASLATSGTLQAEPAPGAPAALPAFDALYKFDEDGRIIPTAEGVITPDGVTLYAGRPSRVPPPRPFEQSSSAAAVHDEAAPTTAATETAPAAVLTVADASQTVADPTHAARTPRSRPGDIAPASEPEPTAQAATAPGLDSARPAPRSAAAIARAREADDRAAAAAALVGASLANLDRNDLASTPRPAARPARLAPPPPAQVATALPTATPNARPRTAVPAAPVAPVASDDDEDEPEIASAVPDRPVNASTTRGATQPKVLNLGQMNLIGVFGTSNSRHALVRERGGRILRVAVGDRLDGGQVVAIGSGDLTYRKGSGVQKLEMPRG